MERDKFRCRRFADKTLPCNWVKDGFCGVDARRCVIEEVKT
jgi:hypothetical protein